MTIDGKEIAAIIIERLKRRPKPDAFLGAIFVGDDAASARFLDQERRVADELGIDFRVMRFPESVSEGALVSAIRDSASDARCGGIIVQLPLPKSLDRNAVLAAIPPEKDVDALHGGGTVPPAVGTVQEILSETRTESAKSRVAVVGAQGFLVGRPVAKWFRGKCAELLTFDIGDDLAPLARADVVVSGTGSPGLLTSSMLKSGALVIDFGYGMKNGKVCGDFDPGSSTTVAYTPTPGGTGPILVAKLFESFYILLGN